MDWISIEKRKPKETEGNIIIACWTKSLVTSIYPDSIYAKIGGNVRIIRYYKEFGWSSLEGQTSFYPFMDCDYWLELPKIPKDLDTTKLKPYNYEKEQIEDFSRLINLMTK